MRALVPHAGVERAAQPSRRLVEALAPHRQQLIGRGQRPRRGPRRLALVVDAARDAGAEPCGKIGQRRFQLRLHRHRHLGRARRRRRAHVGGEVDRRPVGLVADRRDHRKVGGRHRARQRLVVEAPQILQAAAASRHDDEVRTRQRPVSGQGVEPLDGVRDLRARRLALDAHRPDDDMQRKAVADAVQDIADHRACRRGHHADDARHERQKLLARRLEQAFGGQPLLALLQQRHQGADAGRLQIVDDDLVVRLAGIGGELAGGDHLHALFRPEFQPRERAPPHDGVEPRAVVLQREIGMAGGMRAAIAGNLAAHAHVTELVFHRALQRAGNLAHRIFGGIGA